MISRVQILLIVGLASIIQIVGCSDKPQTSTAVPAATPVSVTKTDAVQFFEPVKYTIKDPSWLRQRLPESSLAYLRVPSMVAMFSAAKGNVFSGILQSPVHQKLIRKLEQGLYKTFATETGGMIKPLGQLWLQHIRAPLEIAVLSNEHKQPLPKILVVTRLGFADKDSFHAFIDNWVKSDSRVYRLGKAEKQNGYVSLVSGPFSIEMHYQEQSRLLNVLVGMGVNRKELDQRYSALSVNTKHAMYSQEAQIDSSHGGIFAWFNIEKIMPVIGNVMPPEKFQELKDRAFLKDMRSVALGMGVSRGKGRMSILADFHEGRISKFIPSGDMKADVMTAGKPKLVFGMTVPDAKQFKVLEDNLILPAYKDSTGEYLAFKEMIKTKAGVSIEDLLSVMGPEILYVRDQVGEFSIVAIRDQKKYKKLFEAMRKQLKFDYEVREVEGVKIHHSRMTSYQIEDFRDALRAKSKRKADKAGEKVKGNPLLDLMVRIKTHSYWIEEKGYLVGASVPQLLIDRARYKQKVSIHDWLQKEQSQNTSNALMALSLRIKGVPQALYYTYLEILNVLADFTNTKIDLYQMPTFRNSRLPVSGAYGIQFSSSSNRLGFEISYEATPLEVMGQNVTTAAVVVGILAAIAIPAYQDYVLRSKIAVTYNRTSRARVWIRQFWDKKGRFPERSDIAKFDFDGIMSPDIQRVTIIPGKGTLILTLNGASAVAGKRLTIEPVVGEGGMYWRCGGELENKYLPGRCQ